jgi:DNA-binding transcriptional LysR family regulator
VTELVGHAQSSSHSLTGSIVVGCYQTLTPFVMPRVLAEFNKRHPAIRVDFREGTLEELHGALSRGQLEAAVLYNFGLPSEFAFTTIYDNARTRVLLAEGHRLAARRRVSMASLADEPFIVYEPAAPHYLRLLAGVGVTPTIRHRTSNFEAVRCLVARGLGVSMLNQIPEVSVSYEGRPLVTRDILEPTPPLPVVVAHHAGVRLPRRTRAFIDCCAEVFREPDPTPTSTSAATR